MSANDTPSHESVENERPTKRRRVAVACRPCRDRKSRCDGETPECAACRQQGSECSYPPPLSKTDLLREEFSSITQGLEKRIDDLERILSSSGHQSGTALPGSTDHFAQAVSAKDASRPHSVDAKIVIEESAFQFTNVSESSADGIGIVPLTSRDDYAFFGPSSNIAFLRLVSRVLGKTSRSVISTAHAGSRTENGRPNGQTQGRADAPSPSRQLPAVNQAQRNGSYLLPSDARIKELISMFFCNCGDAYPFLHQGRLIDTYEEVQRTGFRAVRRSWLALLYIVLALAAMSAPNQGVTLAYVNAESEAWYETASDLTLKLVFSETGPNLEVVQCLLYMVSYLQSTHSSAKPSYMLSLAIRMAYALGLHSAEASRCLDPVEAESRKRTWYGLILLDRTLSMVVGRPAEISQDAPALERPLPFPDSARRGCLWQDECAVEYFDANLKLYDNIHRTVDILYVRNSGQRINFDLESIAKIYQLENDLLQWTRDLPPRLAIMRPEELPIEPAPFEKSLESFVRRHRTILTLRHLNARIFVHRPILEGLLEAITTEQPDIRHLRIMRQAGTNSVKLVVLCALQSIELVHRLLVGTTHGHQQLGAWWFSLYYNFHASLAILGSFLVSQPRWECPEIMSGEDRESASRALQLSLEILDGLDNVEERHPTITRCRQYLQNLIQMAEPLQAASSMTNPGSAFQTYGPQQHSMAQLSGDVLHMSGVGGVGRTGQAPSDFDLQSFLFPWDMNGFGGQLIGADQPFF